MAIFLLIMTSIWSFCIFGILVSFLVYSIRYRTWKILCSNADDSVCMCGSSAENHSHFDNHAIFTELDWAIEQKPRFY